MDKTIKNILPYYKNLLKGNNIDTYSLDTELILMHSTNFKKVDIYLNINYTLTNEQFNTFLNCINRRIKKEPIAYILGTCEFMKLDFSLNEHTLIPRPDTEILVSLVIDIMKENNFLSALDIGTGSGAIAISLAKYVENSNIVAVDINENTLSIAKNNANSNDVNISFIQSNLFENITNKFDIIVSNPPYIKTDIIQTLDENVKNYEPHLALDGGNDGLIFYENITKNAHKYLNKNGYLAFEIGYDQRQDVENIMNKYNFKDIKSFKDYSGLDRVVIAKLNN